MGAIVAVSRARKSRTGHTSAREMKPTTRIEVRVDASNPPATYRIVLEPPRLYAVGLVQIPAVKDDTVA